MRIRRAALSATLVALLAAPAASAQNAVLETDRSCYGPRELISLTGYGFTPDSDVALSADGQQLGIGVADYGGLFMASLRAPSLPFAEIVLRFTATDQTYLLNRASARVRLTSFDVNVTPTTGVPSRPRRIRARGFFGGQTLYAHIRRGDRVRNVRVGALTGACRKLNVTRRLFPPSVRDGAYRLHFDTSRRYFRSADTRITYAVKISTRGGRASAAAADIREQWVRVTP